MKKIVLFLDESTMTVHDEQSNLVGSMIGTYEPYKETSTAETTLQLVKQGVSVDEIVKLKNSDLI